MSSADHPLERLRAIGRRAAERGETIREAPALHVLEVCRSDAVDAMAAGRRMVGWADTLEVSPAELAELRAAVHVLEVLAERAGDRLRAAVREVTPNA